MKMMQNCTTMKKLHTEVYLWLELGFNCSNVLVYNTVSPRIYICRHTYYWYLARDPEIWILFNFLMFLITAEPPRIWEACENIQLSSILLILECLYFDAKMRRENLQACIWKRECNAERRTGMMLFPSSSSIKGSDGFLIIIIIFSFLLGWEAEPPLLRVCCFFNWSVVLGLLIFPILPALK